MKSSPSNHLHWVITGATRGIGLELCRQTLQAGHSVSAWVRDPAKSQELKSLEADFSQQLQIVQVDVTQDSAVKGGVLEVQKKTSSVDILVNNAGVYLDGEHDLESLDLRLVSQTFETNAVAPMRVARALLPLLNKAKHPRVANITSLMGSIADNSSGGSYAYRMSKTALNMFTRSFSLDYPKIATLCLHPGWVQTDMGGSNAPTSPQESARGLTKVIMEAQTGQNSQFFDFEGDSLPW